MYLMAAFPTYCKGITQDGGRGIADCSVSGSSIGGCGATADFGLLEIDENDNSFPWGLIHHNELAQMLNAGLGKTMVIDSRSFLEYNTSTIQQSVNVCCSKLVKRRLQQDKVHVLDLLNQTCNIGADASWDVIVYDQCTEDPSQLTSDNFVAVLLHKLSTAFNSVAFLKGGFLSFQASHPSLTENKSSVHRCSTLTSLSQPCMPVSNVGPTRILPFLYLGSQQDSLNQELAQVNGITYILNVSKTCPRPPFILEGHFYRIPVNDNYCEKLLPFFQEAFQFLDKVREANGCVLIHCLGGVSRSATLAIAYIMRYYRMTSDEAYRYVKDKRPTISPNFNFLGQLLEYEKILRQDEQEEVARKKIIKNEERGSGEVDRASPGVMDLHTTSPSSPGPRTAQRPFNVNFSSPLFLSLVTNSEGSSLKFAGSQDCPIPDPADALPMSRHSGQNDSTLFPAVEENLCILKEVKVVTDLPPIPAPPSESCPFPGPSLDLPEPSYKSQHESQPACFSAVCHTYSTDTFMTPSHVSHDPCMSKPDMTPICDNSKQDIEPVLAQSPVCPITGFPSPAGANGDFPESTCPRTGFPGPGFYGSGSKAATRLMTRTLTSNSSEHGHVSVTGTLTETETTYNYSTTYQNLSETCRTPEDLKMDSTVLSFQPDVSDPGKDLLPKSSQKEQTRSRTGFSLSSMLSSLRWKSRPPTLSLGAPISSVKDGTRHMKKHSVESGEKRIQLTPVSEAVENCDLITSEGVNGSAVVTGSLHSDCIESMEQSDFNCVSQVSELGSSLSNATSIAVACTQTNLSSASVSSPSHTHKMLITSEVPFVLHSVVKPTRLNISAKDFTLPFNSPISDCPTPATTPSPPSLGDSNKRKSFPPVNSDSPDKLAKTESSHLHVLSPPKTLNLAQNPIGKMRLRFSSKRPFVLAISSPMTATTEDMARLKVTSPSEPPNVAAAIGDENKRHHSAHLDYENRTEGSVSWATKEPIPKMFFKSSDPHSMPHSKAGVPYGYPKWKSATSLSVTNLSATEATHLGESVTSGRSKTCQQQQRSDTSLFSSMLDSSMPLSASSTLSKSCTSIYSPSAASSSNICSHASFSTCSVNLQGFSQFPTTSLDKLSFTPCYTKDIVQELKRQETVQLASLEQGTSPDGNLGPSMLDSPMSISSGSSAPSIASSTLSPVELSVANPFPDSVYHTCTTDQTSTGFHLAQSQTPLLSCNTVLSDFGSPEGSSSSILSPNSVSEFILSPSTMPQTTVAPTIPTLNSPYYCGSISVESLSPMSLSDSSSSSPVRSPIRNGITSPLPSSMSSPTSSLSSPIVSSPPFSPLISSPVSSSSLVSGSVTSVATNITTKVVLRRDKNKRVIDRPNSIAFSSYPACDLVPVAEGSADVPCQASQDDSSDAYMAGKSKKSRHSRYPVSHPPQGRTSWGGYSEREVYRQITAAMENAMLRTQVFSPSTSNNGRLSSSQVSSRKARSLDDILDSNADEDEFMINQQCSTPWGRRKERSVFDQYRCGMQNVSEPYHSSSSLSSGGSHGGSMEIQVS